MVALTFYNLNPTSKLLGSPSYAWIVLLARKTALAFYTAKPLLLGVGIVTVVVCGKDRQGSFSSIMAEYRHSFIANYE